MAQGGLTTGLLHALVAMDMPGPGTVFLSQSWKFTAPVYIGDTITAEATVLEVHATKPVSRLAIVIRNQNGDVVLDGEAGCYRMQPAGLRPRLNFQRDPRQRHRQSGNVDAHAVHAAGVIGSDRPQFRSRRTSRVDRRRRSRGW